MQRLETAALGGRKLAREFRRDQANAARDHYQRDLTFKSASMACAPSYERRSNRRESSDAASRKIRAGALVTISIERRGRQNRRATRELVEQIHRCAQGGIGGERDRDTGPQHRAR